MKLDDKAYSIRSWALWNGNPPKLNLIGYDPPQSPIAVEDSVFMTVNITTIYHVS